MSKVLICCGGTGGHLSPGIAVAQALVARGHTCKLVISQKQIDAKLIQKYPDLDFVTAPGRAFSWHPVRMLLFLQGQIGNLLFGIRLVRQYRPDLVMGFGGFITVGLGITGKMFKVPLVLHESNRHPGKAIRLLARFAERIYLPRGMRLEGISFRYIREAGFPLRQEIRKIPRVSARIGLGLPEEGKLLLVLGGSQGAHALNQWVITNQEKLANHGIHVLCLTGLGKGEPRGEEYVGPDQKRVQIRYQPFSEEMNFVLNSADLAVARAGAGTIAEFVRCRIPSILVPYPYAADNHQLENARYLEKQGGCVILEESHVESLFMEVHDLIFNDWLLGRLRENLKGLDYDALNEIVCDLEKLLEEQQRISLSSEALTE